MPLDADARKQILSLRDIVVDKFDHGDWMELGLLTGTDAYINGHRRLLRSLSFGDEDYSGHVLETLMHIATASDDGLKVIEELVRRKYGGGGVNISSTVSAGQTIVFQPSVFQVPAELPDPTLLSAMMPFGASFSPVHEAIKAAAKASGMKCMRVDDIWDHSTIIQDVFALIFRSFIVVCDFTDKNPNVFYEAGIAHTLGKHVIPIAQHETDVPFDLRHHRYVRYLPNAQGLVELQKKLCERIDVLTGRTSAPWGNGRAG